MGKALAKEGIRAHGLSEHTLRTPLAPSGNICCPFLLPHSPSSWSQEAAPLS